MEDVNMEQSLRYTPLCQETWDIITYQVDNHISRRVQIIFYNYLIEYNAETEICNVNFRVCDMGRIYLYWLLTGCSLRSVDKCKYNNLRCN